MIELIVAYNARTLEYDKTHDAMDAFTHEPKPSHAMYVPDRTYGVELGTIIATYTTDDPEGLVKQLDDAYGAAIRYVEESGERYESEIDTELRSE